MPISYTAISTYARDHGIVGIEFKHFKQTIQNLDQVFLEVEFERAEQEKQGRERQ